MQTAVRPSMKAGGDMGVGVLVEGEDDAFVRVVEPGPSTSMAPACANRSLPFLGGTTLQLRRAHPRPMTWDEGSLAGLMVSSWLPFQHYTRVCMYLTSAPTPHVPAGRSHGHRVKTCGITGS